jgi:hypothetical protein
VPGHMEGEHYNSRIRGINIDLGDNPTVSGISMSGAQQCRCMHRQLRSLVNMSAMFIALDRLAQSTSCACSEGVMVALACMHDILNVLVPLTQFKWTRFTPSIFATLPAVGPRLRIVPCTALECICMMLHLFLAMRLLRTLCRIMNVPTPDVRVRFLPARARCGFVQTSRPNRVLTSPLPCSLIPILPFHWPLQH